MAHPLVSFVVINYNTKQLIKSCITTLRELTYREKEIIFIDNASHDGSAAYVREDFPDVRLVVNTINNGYAGAANQALHSAHGEFVLILNPDIVFEPDYVDILVRTAEKDPHIGAIIGKLRRYDFSKNEKTNIIDSAGLVMYRSRRCVDRGQSEEDLGQYDAPEEVFGITGACPLYRKTALEDCEIFGEAFDSGFFMYKEDVDISWRMRLLGWKCYYEPTAIAYHGRGTGIYDRASVLSVAKNRKHLSPFQKKFAYINERLMRVKNELPSQVVRDIGPILWKEILMTGWMTFKEPYLWKAFFQFLRKLPHALRQRREVMGRVKVSPEKLARFFR